MRSDILRLPVPSGSIDMPVAVRVLFERRKRLAQHRHCLLYPPFSSVPEQGQRGAHGDNGLFSPQQACATCGTHKNTASLSFPPCQPETSTFEPSLTLLYPRSPCYLDPVRSCPRGESGTSGTTVKTLTALAISGCCQSLANQPPLTVDDPNSRKTFLIESRFSLVDSCMSLV